jgi:hypothetical protein
LQKQQTEKRRPMKKQRIPYVETKGTRRRYAPRLSKKKEITQSRKEMIEELRRLIENEILTGFPTLPVERHYPHGGCLQVQSTLNKFHYGSDGQEGGKRFAGK